MAEPWVPGAWDPQLFLQGKLLGRGRERVPLSSGRRAVSASSSLEGNTLTPLRRDGLPPHPPAGAPPPAVCIPQPGHPLPRAVLVPPPSQLTASLEPCSRGRYDSIGYCYSYFQRFLLVFLLVAIFWRIPDLLIILSLVSAAVPFSTGHSQTLKTERLSFLLSGHRLLFITLSYFVFTITFGSIWREPLCLWQCSMSE